MITAYSYYTGKFWDGMFFKANRSHAQPFNVGNRLPRNCCLWKTKA